MSELNYGMLWVSLGMSELGSGMPKPGFEMSGLSFGKREPNSGLPAGAEMTAEVTDDTDEKIPHVCDWRFGEGGGAEGTNRGGRGCHG